MSQSDPNTFRWIICLAFAMLFVILFAFAWGYENLGPILNR